MKIKPCNADSLLRDDFGIIIQAGDCEGASGGDSAFSTGIMAFSGSVQDQRILSLFIINNKLVRHPYQERWNEPCLTSRDQVIAYFAGLRELKSFGNVGCDPVSLACLGYAKSWRVNTDILTFADKYYLYRCAGVESSWWLKASAYINQFLNLLWDCFVDPHREMNQRILMNIVYGAWWIEKMKNWHPNLLNNVSEYFGGWRAKNSIALIFNAKILEVIKG